MGRSIQKARGALPAIVVLALAVMGSDSTCADMSGPVGPGYSQQGHSPARGQQFYEPSVGGNRVDRCLHWGDQCGGPAATAFCQRMGYDRATAWIIAPNVSARTPTLVLGDGVLCTQPGCDGFETVTCARGTVQVAPPRPQGGHGQETFTDEPDTDRPGLNYNSVILQKADPKQCKSLCRQDPKCRAYTYAPPGVQMPNTAVCWLKRGVPAPVAANGLISGVKR